MLRKKWLSAVIVLGVFIFSSICQNLSAEQIFSEDFESGKINNEKWDVLIRETKEWKTVKSSEEIFARVEEGVCHLFNHQEGTNVDLFLREGFPVIHTVEFDFLRPSSEGGSYPAYINYQQHWWLQANVEGAEISLQLDGRQDKGSSAMEVSEVVQLKTDQWYRVRVDNLPEQAKVSIYDLKENKKLIGTYIIKHIVMPPGRLSFACPATQAEVPVGLKIDNIRVYYPPKED